MDQKDIEILISALKAGKSDLARKLFDNDIVEFFSEKLRERGELPEYQVLFLDDKTGAWHCLRPMVAAHAGAWVRALKDDHKVLLRKGNDIFFTCRRKNGIALRPQEALEILNSLLHKPIRTSKDLDKWVLDNNPITYRDCRFFIKRTVDLPDAVWPTSGTNLELAALATSHLPEALVTEYDSLGGEIRGLRKQLPIKKLHSVPRHHKTKSRGHNGCKTEQSHQLRFTSTVSELISLLDVSEEIEETGTCYKVFCHSYKRYQFWLKQANKRGFPISQSEPTVGSDRSRYRIRFFKTKRHHDEWVAVSLRDERRRKAEKELDKLLSPRQQKVLRVVLGK